MSRNFFPEGASIWRRLLLILTVLLFFFSCAASPYINGPQPSHLIRNVPFFPQEIYQCGPASLAGVLNYWGILITPEEIASEIYSRSAKGTLNIDMVWYSEKKGLKADFYNGSVEDLKKKIDSGFPLIVMVDYGFGIVQQNHFMVIVGYSDERIIANSGREQLKHISLKSFTKPWERAKFWTLWIAPQS